MNFAGHRIVVAIHDDELPLTEDSRRKDKLTRIGIIRDAVTRQIDAGTSVDNLDPLWCRRRADLIEHRSCRRRRRAAYGPGRTPGYGTRPPIQRIIRVSIKIHKFERSAFAVGRSRPQPTIMIVE